MSKIGNLRGFQHLGLPVGDIEASKKWHSEYLGFEVIRETKFTDGGKEVKVAFMKLNEFVIEMYELSRDEFDAIKSDGHIDHISFDVDDIDEVGEKLQRAGLKTIDETPRFLPFFEKGVRFLNIYGPNNEKIEFNQKIIYLIPGR